MPSIHHLLVALFIPYQTKWHVCYAGHSALILASVPLSVCYVWPIVDLPNMHTYTYTAGHKHNHIWTREYSHLITMHRGTDHKTLCSIMRLKHGLTHWGRVTHICVSKLTILGSDNGFLLARDVANIFKSVLSLLYRRRMSGFRVPFIYVGTTYSFDRICLVTNRVDGAMKFLQTWMNWSFRRFLKCLCD